MHLLYMDEAGSVTDSSQRHFILAGIALFERQTHWLQTELDDIVNSLGHPDPDRLEIHASHIVNGRGWRQQRELRNRRRAIILDGLAASSALRGDWRLFGAVIDKQALSPQDPVEYAFEQLCSRFDHFLRRLYRQGNSQRGLIILDAILLRRFAKLPMPRGRLVERLSTRLGL